MGAKQDSLSSHWAHFADSRHSMILTSKAWYEACRHAEYHSMAGPGVSIFARCGALLPGRVPLRFYRSIYTMLIDHGAMPQRSLTGLSLTCRALNRTPIAALNTRLNTASNTRTSKFDLLFEPAVCGAASNDLVVTLGRMCDTTVAIRDIRPARERVPLNIPLVLVLLESMPRASLFWLFTMMMEEACCPIDANLFASCSYTHAEFVEVLDTLRDKNPTAYRHLVSQNTVGLFNLLMPRFKEIYGWLDEYLCTHSLN
jgi:hypothetical protein